MAEKSKKILRSLPSVDVVLRSGPGCEAVAEFGHMAVTEAVRSVIAEIRKSMLSGGKGKTETDIHAVIAGARSLLSAGRRSNLRRVVNATGIILHTGLGRAAMPETVRDALAVAAGSCNVQIDLASGKRGRREEVVRDLVRELTGAEDILLVNNNAGATMLVLRALAKGREVVISRGELIEIGGSFRLPDIMEESGTILREVGTTNKTHLRDYEKAIGPETALLMKAHKSNYKIVGFTKDVGIKEIAALGRKRKIPVIDDIGCGAMTGLEKYGLEHEMTVRESLEAGADIVLFSTDKLIGGPQGGLIVGKKELIAQIKSHPLYRVLRVCKLTLGALEATLKLFKSPDLIEKTHPVYRMLGKGLEEMETQARAVAADLLKMKPEWRVTVEKTVSYLGGGALPAEELPSFAVAIAAKGKAADDLAWRFRQAETPVIPRVSDDAVLLDMRTVQKDEVAFVTQAVAAIATTAKRGE